MNVALDRIAAHLQDKGTSAYALDVTTADFDACMHNDDLVESPLWAVAAKHAEDTSASNSYGYN